jgi:hypothetical protein
MMMHLDKDLFFIIKKEKTFKKSIKVRLKSWKFVYTHSARFGVPISLHLKFSVESIQCPFEYFGIDLHIGEQYISDM